MTRQCLTAPTSLSPAAPTAPPAATSAAVTGSRTAPLLTAARSTSASCRGARKRARVWLRRKSAFVGARNVNLLLLVGEEEVAQKRIRLVDSVDAEKEEEEEGGLSRNARQLSAKTRMVVCRTRAVALASASVGRRGSSAT